MPAARARRRCAAALAALCVALAAAGPARAQPVDQATRATARKVAAEALTSFEKGEYAVALEKFELANQLVPAPTLALRAARCLEKLGRLVEASERYLEVTRMKLGATAPFQHRKAQVEALQERDKLAPRIPSLEVALEGPVGKGVTVSLDGKPVPGALIGQKQAIDPGKHVVEAARADTKVKREVELREGEESRVALELPPLPVPPKPPPPPSPLPTYGWIALGVGAGGLAIGLANGVAALAQQGSLEERCPDRNCPPEAHGDADLYDATRVITTVGLAVGAAFAATGVTLLVLAPAEGTRSGGRGGDDGRPPPPRAAAFVTWGGAGVRGIF